MKRTRLTSSLAIMLSAALVLSTAGCGGNGSNSGGSTTAAGGTQATETTQAPAGTQSADAAQAGETTERKLYESNFTASGTDPETYNQNIATVLDEVTDYFAETGELDTKLTGYEEPITVKTALSYAPVAVDDINVYTELYGETMDNNRWNDMYKQMYNIDLQYDWMALSSDYSETLRLETAAGELPDIFMVFNQEDLLALKDADMICDLTDVYHEYATDMLKSKYKEDDYSSLTYATIDGQLYAIPSANSTTGFVSYLYIRDDWMEKLNLEYPKSLEELKDIMKAFMTQDPDGNGVDDTWGLGLTKELSSYYTRGIAAGFGAYPEYWIEKDGEIIYGGVADEVKPYLSYLADLYKEGYIDPEFVAYSDKELTAQVASEKVGIVYQSHGFLANNTGSLHETNPEARWKALQLPEIAGEDVRSIIAPSVPTYLCVNKNFEHPEIAVKIVDFNTMIGAGKCTLSSWLIYGQTTSQLWNYCGTYTYPVGGWSNLTAYRYIMDAYASEDYVSGDPDSVMDSVLKDADSKSKAYWDMQFNEDETFRWAQVGIYGPGEDTPNYVLEQAYEKGNLFMTPFYGVQNQTMQDNWSTIEDQKDQIFTDIVIGNISVDDGFQKWLDVFKALKGDEITAFANEQAPKLKEIQASYEN